MLTGMLTEVFISPVPEPIWISFTAKISAWIVELWIALKGSWSFVEKESSLVTSCLVEVSTSTVNEEPLPGIMVTGKVWLMEKGASVS